MKRAIGIWLLVCSGFVWLVLVSGGVTRLTHSGLSIVEWKPVVGVVPPLGEARWEAEFEKYRHSPEYLLVNFGMTLRDFKSIYLMEYAHRLLGRAAGLVFVVPFLYFTLKGSIDRSLIPKLSAVSLLWALQGALGWFMVSSGLVNEPHVSHYRLTAHLLTACLLYASMISIALELLRPIKTARPPAPWLRTASAVLVALAFVTIASGGLVAGLHAGFAYNTFPLMDGRLVPPYLFSQSPLARNFFENLVTVQFDHRLLAFLLTAGVLSSWAGGISGSLPRRPMMALHALVAALAAQVTLGVLTLRYRVPVVLGAAHQGTALILLGAALFFRHESAAGSSLDG
jgi:cytochrome c oxidase assembly protein subunit 15